MSNPLNVEENLLFCRAKTVVQCTSAGQFTEPRTNAKLLFVRRGCRQKFFPGQSLTHPNKISSPFVSASACLHVIAFLLRLKSSLVSGRNGSKKQHKAYFSLLVNFVRLRNERISEDSALVILQ